MKESPSGLKSGVGSRYHINFLIREFDVEYKCGGIIRILIGARHEGRARYGHNLSTWSMA